jgi:formylglycine-generating enzyme required for sulfatase activity
MKKSTSDADTEALLQFSRNIHSARKSENKHFVEFSRLIREDFASFSKNFKGIDELLALQSLEKRVERIANFSFIETKTLGAIGGGFSAGKSCFINSFIPEILLAEKTDRATAIPSYVSYGDKVSIAGISKDGGTFSIEKDEYRKINRDFVELFREKVGYSIQDCVPYISVLCPMDQALFGNICLIDTPGYNPGGHFSQKDFETAQEYIKDAEFLIWVVDIRAGTINDGDIKFLNSLIEKSGKRYNLYILANWADSRDEASIKSVLDRFEKDLKRVNAKYYGISAYSSLNKEEITFRLMDIKEFLRQNNNPSGKIVEIYETINSIFDGYDKTLNAEKARQKELHGAINKVHLEDIQKNYAARGKGDGKNTEAIVKLKNVISSSNGNIDFDTSLKNSQALRKQFIACLDNLCDQFNISKKPPEISDIPDPKGNANTLTSSGKKPPNKHIASKLIIAFVVVLIPLAIFFRSGSSNRKQENQSIIQSPLSLSPFPGFIRITGGTFIMGSPETEEGHEEDETQHTVTVDDFYISEKEITLAEFKIFIKETGLKTLPELSAIGFVEADGEMIVKNDATYLKPYIFQNDNHPVVEVSWYDAINYCNWRSQNENLTPVYKIDGDTVEWDLSGNGYRLPTEAEWEYACRAGSVGAFHSGFSGLIAPSDGTTEVAVSAPANSWGLYDLHTNVSEWCWDIYDELEDGTSIPARVVRGGNWSASAFQARSAYRSAGNPKYGSNVIGFRIALSGKEKEN